MADKVKKIREEVERLRIKNTEAFDCGCDGTKCAGYDMACNDILSFIDSLQEEPVSEELEEACDFYYDETWDEHGGRAMVIDGCHDIWFPSHATDDFFKAGAEWQKEHFEKERLKHCDKLTEEQAQKGE